MADPEWQVFSAAEEIAKLAASSGPYHEFLRVPSLSCGIYSMRAGSKDLQSPHDEDEMYFVIDGKARVRVGEVEREVGRGSILYVSATSEHSFIEIEEDMTLLVFFASGGPSE